MLDVNYALIQALRLSLATVLSLSLLGCAQNQSDVSRTDSDNSSNAYVPDKLEQPIQSNDISTSYVLAEPLPQKRIKVTITAKDKPLTIVNCNQVITLTLLNPLNKERVWGGVSDACRSPDIIIPKGASLSLVVDFSNADEQSLPANTPYLVAVGLLNDDSFDNPKNGQMTIEDQTSNEFILLP